ncbi:hypothetical protein NMG60_11031040 [Bertholletia excelsa]
MYHGRIGNGEVAVVKNRFLGFLIWQSVQSTTVYLVCKALLLSPFFTRQPLSAFLVGCLAFFAFHLSLLLFSSCLFAVASAQPHGSASPVELVLGLIRLIFVSGGQPLPSDFRRRARISLGFLLFVAASALSGFLSLISVCYNCFHGSFAQRNRPGNYWHLVGILGFRGFAVGLFFGINYLYKKRWVLEFPIIQRPTFFSFKMGILSATLRALKLSSVAYLFSAFLAVFASNEYKDQLTVGTLIAEQIILYIGIFLTILCWELNHHLHQVMHMKRFVFAPPKGSAAAETNPSEPLLAALEDSMPRSLVQYLAYLDLCMVCESNVDIWRRAAFFEETGDTYRRVMAVCLRPLEQLALELGEGLESCPTDKSLQLGNQLPSPTDLQLDPRIQKAFYDFQLHAWCARTVASLTVHSHKEDRFGVAQLSGSIAAVISTLLSCLLAVELLMGKKTNMQSPLHPTGPAGIKWATLSTGRGEATTGTIGKRRGRGRGRDSPLYSKAYSMADILRTSIYCIVSAFHNEMVTSDKAGNLAKDWITNKKCLYGNPELLVQKLRLFLDFRAC